LNRAGQEVLIEQISFIIVTAVILAATVWMRRAVRQTTLFGAWVWAVVAVSAWLASSILETVLPKSPIVWQAWYATAVLCLCPGIAVLGSRRPTVRVWNWFVVLPLIAVLMLPVMVCWLPRGPARPAMPTAGMVAFGIVAVMSFGNYAGTRHLYYSFIAPFSVIGAMVLAHDPTNPRIAWLSVLMLIALLEWACGKVLMGGIEVWRSPWNRLWTDFRDLFGIVWALRIAERVNAQAAKDGWSVRLGMRGFVDAQSGERADSPAEDPRVDHTLRWLLRRFVDEDWMSARVGRAAAGTSENEEKLTG
jgi:hypothetical protein